MNKNSACCRTTIYLFSLQFMASRCCSKTAFFSKWTSNFFTYVSDCTFQILYDFLETLLLSTIQRFIRQFHTEKNAIFKAKTLSKWLTADCAAHAIRNDGSWTHICKVRAESIEENSFENLMIGLSRFEFRVIIFVLHLTLNCHIFVF